MNLAPIVLFVYNRQWHTQQTIEALLKNDLASKSGLIIYSDAARDREAQYGVRKVREFIHTIDGFSSVTIIERDENFGLARSIITGVSEVVDRFGKIIVLEDDLVTSPHFLRYMNEALELYQDDEKVASIHGYLYPLGKEFSEPFFIRGADCWGWGTWRRAWACFEPDGGTLLAELQRRQLTDRFDFCGTHPYTEMLQAQMCGDIDSWAIRWNAAAFLKDMLTLYPHVSLVHNIGLDCSGTHCDDEAYHETKLAEKPVEVSNIPIEENLDAFQEFARYFTLLKIARENAIKKDMRWQFLYRTRNRMVHYARTAIKLITPKRFHGEQFDYRGNYASWQEAQQASGGYDSDLILNKVRDALLQVKRGEAVYERDSVLFDEVQYSWPLLAGLLWVASQNGNRLNLIDFGGSLGSSFYQNKALLAHLAELQWSIIEQQNFVACGQKYFETEQLRFYRTLDDCMAEQHPDTMLLCSVLPYLEKPYKLLQEVIDRGFSFIIVDRTPVFEDGDDRITVQNVPPTIYKASYPAWFLNKAKLCRFLEPAYELVAEFDSLAGEVPLEDTTAYEKGFIFRKRV